MFDLNIKATHYSLINFSLFTGVCFINILAFLFLAAKHVVAEFGKRTSVPKKMERWTNDGSSGVTRKCRGYGLCLSDAHGGGGVITTSQNY